MVAAQDQQTGRAGGVLRDVGALMVVVGLFLGPPAALGAFIGAFTSRVFGPWQPLPTQIRAVDDFEEARAYVLELRSRPHDPSTPYLDVALWEGSPGEGWEVTFPVKAHVTQGWRVRGLNWLLVGETEHFTCLRLRAGSVEIVPPDSGCDEPRDRAQWRLNPDGTWSAVPSPPTTEPTYPGRW